MKSGSKIEWFLNVVVIALALLALGLVAASFGQFSETKAVYQGF